MTTTPETDSKTIWTEDTHTTKGIGLEIVCADLSRKLERERDEYFKELTAIRLAANTGVIELQEQNDELKRKLATYIELCNRYESERNQLRSVCDELATAFKQEMIMFFGHADDCDCSKCEALTTYNNLPHVKEKQHLTTVPKQTTLTKD